MLSPVPVSGGHRFRTLQAGGIATCAIRQDGLPLCWGINSYGSVGQSNVDR
jgi:alpha-tubulin suppressor-like RCC1 family protein